MGHIRTCRRSAPAHHAPLVLGNLAPGNSAVPVAEVVSLAPMHKPGMDAVVVESVEEIAASQVDVRLETAASLEVREPREWWRSPFAKVGKDEPEILLGRITLDLDAAAERLRLGR